MGAMPMERTEEGWADKTGVKVGLRQGLALSPFHICRGDGCGF